MFSRLLLSKRWKFGNHGLFLFIIVISKSSNLRLPYTFLLDNLGAVHMSRASLANWADLSHENLYF